MSPDTDPPVDLTARLRHRLRAEVEARRMAEARLGQRLQAETSARRQLEREVARLRQELTKVVRKRA